MKKAQPQPRTVLTEFGKKKIAELFNGRTNLSLISKNELMVQCVLLSEKVDKLLVDLFYENANHPIFLRMHEATKTGSEIKKKEASAALLALRRAKIALQERRNKDAKKS